jgi:hypothetical protein
MAKGVKGAVNPFDQYRLRESATVSAMLSPKAFVLNGVSFAAGDFIVSDPESGALTGVAAADFEAKYEKVKATRGPRKAKTPTGQLEASNEASSEVAEPVAA